MAKLAAEAEAAGWDGFFIWDHMVWTAPANQPVSDPYILLAAMASATQRLILGPMVTPIARRRPHKLAREAVTLDQLSNGRFVLGAGIGGDWFGDYSTFGEAPDDRTHAEMLDEGLEILAGLWSRRAFQLSRQALLRERRCISPTSRYSSHGYQSGWLAGGRTRSLS